MSSYDVHQKLRTKAVRLVKKQQIDQAIDELYAGARDLLAAKDQGSGCDLGIYMIQLYEQSSRPCDAEARNRVMSLLALALPDFWRKKLLDAAVKWTMKLSGTSTGDPLLRLSIAELVSKEGAYHYAETHYFAACSESSAPDLCTSFALSTWNWLNNYADEVASADPSAEKNQIVRIFAGDFALRVTIPLVASGSVQSSKLVLAKFLSILTSRQTAILLPVTPNPRPYQAPGATPALVSAADSHIHKTRGAPIPSQLRDSWKALINQWHREAEGEQEQIILLKNDINIISSKFFQMAAPHSKSNALQDMMAGLLGGGSTSSSSTAVVQRQPNQLPPPPISVKATGANQGSDPPLSADDEEDLD